MDPAASIIDSELVAATASCDEHLAHVWCAVESLYRTQTNIVEPAVEELLAIAVLMTREWAAISRETLARMVIAKARPTSACAMGQRLAQLEAEREAADKQLALEIAECDARFTARRRAAFTKFRTRATVILTAATKKDEQRRRSERQLLALARVGKK
ncbi:hypothetical protein HK105_201077 [Polyrhizophydium stewartii]|uniref:Uncharacterized protein n=1 Tax=Polyrhizophydium stewartii TaxID=2732419 RepID=A0ABR4NIS1_9FUNG